MQKHRLYCFADVRLYAFITRVCESIELYLWMSLENNDLLMENKQLIDIRFNIYSLKGCLRLLFGIGNIRHEVISYDKNHMVTCLISPLQVYH